MEKNRIELTGTIHKIFKLKTKAGGPMTKVLLKVGNQSDDGGINEVFSKDPKKRTM